VSQIDWRTYSDDDVLAEAVEIALELAEAAEEQVMTGIIVPDIEGWPAPGRPLRLELQVKSFLRAAADSLEWGARAMGVRFSETGMSCLRYLGEMSALLAWLAEPDDGARRQMRAFELHLSAVRREIKMIRHINKREVDPEKQKGNLLLHLRTEHT
jgi:hypothetical protein